jgi:chromosome segregation ATPase
MSNEGAPGGALRNNENHEAYNILDELVKGKQLEPANAEEAKLKFYKLHEALVENMEAEQKLMKKARALQKELSNELLKLEKTQQQQAENEALLKELANQITEVKKELEVIMERKESLKSEFNKLEVEKDEIERELKKKVENETNRLLPEIEKYKRLIMDIELDKINNNKVIAKETEKNGDLNKRIEELEEKKDELREEHDKAMTNYIKIKDEPTRIGKGNENLKI